MSNLMPEGELVRRAAAHIAETRKEQPQRPIIDIVDEASMRFNLSPLESQALLRLFDNETTSVKACKGDSHISTKVEECHMDENTAAICGLFCGDCALYQNECHGCFSDKIAEHCVECDFRDCAKKHCVVRCYECEEFPCKKLKEFSTQHWENGICHHANVIPDLRYMKEHGVGAWVEKKSIESTCAHCGEVIFWYDRGIHKCKAKAREDAKRE